MAETRKLTGQKSIGVRVASPLTGPVRFLQSLKRNPIITKELRGRMRSWRALFNLGLYVGILSVFAILTYAVSMPRSSNYTGYYGYSSYYYNSGFERLGSSIFSGIIVVQLLLIGLLAPGFTAGVLSGEKERQTYEILLLTLLRPVDIVLGKLFSTLSYLFLLIIAAIPVESIVFLVGGVGFDQLIVGLVVPLVATLMLGTLGVMWSSFLQTSGRASRSTYITVIVLVLGLPALGIPLSMLIYGFYNDTDSGYFLLNWASAFNPGVAIVATNELLLSTGSTIREHNIFYYIRSNGDVYPMPWVNFVIVALALSVLFTVLAIRFVKPLKTDGDLARKGKKKKNQAISS